ncbi:60Kd inner membrane protein-domain-containing protein [Endogone sp. FLAS-F59071]|nr:60Kd inner membrane protein-domain-containing protein [Endogone sp. FLAS-F59071]|eukprot:RUS22498.1 60Kd inner membrane protein-domain-containing protein [Endogone sp. FLAS-F59071]
MHRAAHFLSRRLVPLPKPLCPPKIPDRSFFPHIRSCNSPITRAFASSPAALKSFQSAEQDHDYPLLNTPNENASVPTGQIDASDFVHAPFCLDPTTTDQVNFMLAANQSFLEALHNNGLPWWAAIVVATVCLRSAFTFPIALYQQRNIARRIALAPMVESWAETLKYSVAKESKMRRISYDEYNVELQKQVRKWSNRLGYSLYRAKIKQLYRENNCSPLRAFLLPWVQIPLFISMSLTIRGMAAYPLPWLSNPNLPVHGFTDGGLAWFVDLTQADSTWILPVAIGLTNLLNIESLHRYDPGRFSSSHGSLPVLGDVKLVQRPSKCWVLYTSSAEEIGASVLNYMRNLTHRMV